MKLCYWQIRTSVSLLTALKCRTGFTSDCNDVACASDVPFNYVSNLNSCRNDPHAGFGKKSSVCCPIIEDQRDKLHFAFQSHDPSAILHLPR